MRIILKENIDNLGKIGDIVDVKNGYARNFLLPRSLANIANERNKKQWLHIKKNLERKKELNLNLAKSLAKKVEKASVTINKPTGGEGRIFGSVTTAELANLLKLEGLEISRRQIEITEEMKKVGVYTVEVKLHTEVRAKFKVWVVSE